MELFATDRERLAFLLETDAAFDLDFEALEAQAETAAGEPSLEQRPKYITNYIGSKQKLFLKATHSDSFECAITMPSKGIAPKPSVP